MLMKKRRYAILLYLQNEHLVKRSRRRRRNYYRMNPIALQTLRTTHTHTYHMCNLQLVRPQSTRYNIIELNGNNAPGNRLCIVKNAVELHNYTKSKPI